MSAENKKLHYSKIKMLKESLGECIVQICPSLPNGQYKRRRSYTKQHKSSWIASLEKSKYVKCLFQNCHFIAMSLEDMISHFGYCNGDSSFAKFKCSFCQGCVTTEDILKMHVDRSHRKLSITEKEQTETFLNLNVQKSETANKKRVDIKLQESTCNDYFKSKKSILKLDEGLNEATFNKINSIKNKNEDKPEMKPKKRKPSFITSCKFSMKSQDKTESSSISDEPPVKKIKNESNKSTETLPVKKKRGRKPKQKSVQVETEVNPSVETEIQCGKCKDFKGTRKSFENHNFKKHVGLGWIEGDIPVDLNNEQQVIKLVKEAFKFTKKGTCEVCKDVKKSFMGFVSHVQTCGKTKEEKDSIKIQCPYCSAKCLKYSMPVHIKLSHAENNETNDSDTKNISQNNSNNVIFPVGKRRSALKAASKFQEVLKIIDEPETSNVKYVFYEKNAGKKFPKVCSRLSNFWYKCQREKKEITCQHENCTVISGSVEEAKRHHFTCPQLPDAVYMCEACSFYSLNESDLVSHVSAHHNRISRKKQEGEEKCFQKDDNADEYSDNDSHESDENHSKDELSDLDDSKKKKSSNRKSSKNTEKLRRKKGDVDDDFYYKKLFCKRGNIENKKKVPFFSNTLNITLDEELNANQNENLWPEFQTQKSDWKNLSLEQSSDFLPQIAHSISICTNNSYNFREGNEIIFKWRRFNRFEGDLIEELPTIFAGGSIRCMSWCKISYHRSIAKKVKQYLALSTTKHLNYLRDILNQSESCPISLLQIWDLGVLKNGPANDVPKFSIGIRHEGEIWDLSWFPEDTYDEGFEEQFSRLGLLATAADDGIIRVWSICDPDQLTSKESRIYETQPVAKLIVDEDLKTSCFRLSIGKNGIIAGGFGNGIVAFWTLNSISSVLCERDDKCGILRPFLTIQAHRTAVISLTFCPYDSRYIASAALDRIVKFWDLESPTRPIEQFSRELCLGTVWPKNWPLVICNFDDVMPTPNKGIAKFIKDIFYDKHNPCLVLDDLCLNLSFSDWLNILCGSNSKGDVRVSLVQNFISDQKKNTNIKTLSSSRFHELNDPKDICEEKVENVKSKKIVEPNITDLKYEEIDSRFGLIFSESFTENDIKSKNQKKNFEEIPIKAVNKVCFNPNFESFTHVAAGYNCGFVRILRLKDLQSDCNIKNFIKMHNKLST